MLFIERNQDFPVHRSDRGRVAERNIDATVGQADVIEHDVDLLAAHEFAYCRLHFRKVLLCLLQSRAGGRADVEAHLPRVHLREEVASQKRKQQCRDDDERQERNDREAGLG